MSVLLYVSASFISLFLLFYLCLLANNRAHHYRCPEINDAPSIPACRDEDDVGEGLLVSGYFTMLGNVSRREGCVTEAGDDVTVVVVVVVVVTG